MTALPNGLTAGTWNVDVAHSEAAFTVRHAGIAKVRGTVAITEGAITVGEDLASSSVSVTLDPSTINTGNESRDGHLKTADFFEVESFPTWTFQSTSVTEDGGDYKIAGDLTIHGVTKPVVLETEFNGVANANGERAGFSAEVEISRGDFGLTWNSALEAGGVLVSDKVKVAIELSAVKA